MYQCPLFAFCVEIGDEAVHEIAVQRLDLIREFVNDIVEAKNEEERKSILGNLNKIMFGNKQAARLLANELQNISHSESVRFYLVSISTIFLQI